MKWEYETVPVSDLTDETLRVMGNDDWELVCVLPARSGQYCDRACFKRPAEDGDERPVRAG